MATSFQQRVAANGRARRRGRRCVKHWHGAAPDSWFQHIALEVPGTGGRNEWLEPVDDAAYTEATVQNKALVVYYSRTGENYARPAIVGDVEIFDEYDAVYVGYPIWWGVPPMCVFTFFEKHDWAGKTVKPFCTHEGSGLGGSVRAIRKALPAATVADGLVIQGQTAQNDRPAAQSAVDRWLGL